MISKWIDPEVAAEAINKKLAASQHKPTLADAIHNINADIARMWGGQYGDLKDMNAVEFRQLRLAYTNLGNLITELKEGQEKKAERYDHLPKTWTMTEDERREDYLRTRREKN